MRWGILQKSFSEKFAKITEKLPVLESLSNNVTGLHFVRLVTLLKFQNLPFADVYKIHKIRRQAPVFESIFKYSFRFLCFAKNVLKFLRTLFWQSKMDDCLHVNFEKFFRISFFWDTSGRRLISCTSCIISTSMYNKILFHGCFSSM